MSWPTKRLGEIGEIMGGFAFKSNDLVNEKASENYLPVIKIGNVLKGGELDIINVQYHQFDQFLEKYLIREGDILVAMTGATVGKVICSTENNLLLNQRVGLIRAHKDMADQNFVSIVLQTKEFYDYCQRTAGGGAQSNISPSQIMQYEVRLPPLKVQKQIVERLDKIVEAQKLNDALSQKSDEFFNSLLYREFDPAGKKWEIKKIKDVATVQNGGTPSTKNPKYWNGKILWLTPKELSNFEDTEIFDTERKISDEGLYHSSAALLPTGTVLFTSRAPIGYVAIAGVPMATNQGFKNFVCDGKQLNNKFLYFFLRLKKKYLQSLGRGATFTEISKTIVEKVEIPLPPLNTQKQIVEKLSAAQDYKTQLLAQKSKLKELFDSVLAKSFSGKL